MQALKKVMLTRNTNSGPVKEYYTIDSYSWISTTSMVLYTTRGSAG